MQRQFNGLWKAPARILVSFQAPQDQIDTKDFQATDLKDRGSKPLKLTVQGAIGV